MSDDESFDALVSGPSVNSSSVLSHKMLWTYTAGISGIIVLILLTQLNATYSQNREIGEMRIEIRANTDAANQRIVRLENTVERILTARP